MAEKGIRKKALLAIGIISVLIAGSAVFYLLFLAGDEDPIMSMRFSDKVLVEIGSTDVGRDHSVESLNQFAVDIYRELARNSSDNVFFSPLSLYIALSMAMEGSRNETFIAMRDALRIVDDNETRRGSFASIQNDLNSRKGCELSLVNNVWVREDVVVKPEFNDTIRDYYMASIEKAPFLTDPEGARKTINDLISDHTRGRIKELIPEGMIDPYMAAVLTNAIYFKGQWEHGFDPDDTKDRPFTLDDGSTVNARMMHIDPEDKKDDIEFMVSINSTLDALRMDYRGGDISMLFMLPGGVGSQIEGLDPITIGEFEGMLDADLIRRTNSDLNEEEIAVTMPKFSFETDYSMNKPLVDLGMGIAFDKYNADFRGLKDPIPENTYIDKVLHKTFISVDESGTEAAAATPVLMVFTDAMMEINLNHPFIFLIQDNDTGLILFMGRVMDPTR